MPKGASLDAFVAKDRVGVGEGRLAFVHHVGDWPKLAEHQTVVVHTFVVDAYFVVGGQSDLEEAFDGAEDLFEALGAVESKVPLRDSHYFPEQERKGGQTKRE